MWVWITIFIIIAVILYCCVRVGARADKEMERFFTGMSNQKEP